MFVMQNLLIAVARVLDIALSIYMWIIIARAILSWVNPDPRNTIVQILYRATEPVLFWVRRRLPLNLGGLDVTPIIVILAIARLPLEILEELRPLLFDTRVPRAEHVVELAVGRVIRVRFELPDRFVDLGFHLGFESFLTLGVPETDRLQVLAQA